jgi:hypothetical protein
MNDSDGNQRLSRLDQQLVLLARQLMSSEHRQLIRQFICGAVAQSAEQRALVPPTVVRIHAAQLPRDPKRQLTPM